MYYVFGIGKYKWEKWPQWAHAMLLHIWNKETNLFFFSFPTWKKIMWPFSKETFWWAVLFILYIANTWAHINDGCHTPHLFQDAVSDKNKQSCSTTIFSQICDQTSDVHSPSFHKRYGDEESSLGRRTPPIQMQSISQKLLLCVIIVTPT